MGNGKCLDISANRSARKYTGRVLLLRVLWSMVHPLYRWSPRLFWGWRRFLLRLYGAKVGPGVRVFPSVKIFAPWNFSIGTDSSIGFDALIYNLGPVSVGERVTLSQRVHICAGTHDYRDPVMPLIKSPIIIEDEVWVCADSFVGPGVTIGNGAVVAACSVVISDVENWSLVGGNPAKFIKERELDK